MRDLPPVYYLSVWRRIGISALRKGWELTWATALLTFYLMFLSGLCLLHIPHPAHGFLVLFQTWLPVAALMASGVIFLTEDWEAAGEDVSRK